MPSIELYLTYVIASFAVVIVPGPTVTVIIANSLKYGARAGLLNVAGTQVGLAIMVGLLALGLSTLIANMGALFDWLRLAGAAYLVWLGIKLLRSDGHISAAKAKKTNFFTQGFIVIWSNPKALVFFGAFIPQFMNAEADPMMQIIVLGLTFMVIATIFDGLYAILAGRAGSMLSQKRVRLIEIASGSFLIGGGAWLASLKGNG